MQNFSMKFEISDRSSIISFLRTHLSHFLNQTVGCMSVDMIGIGEAVANAVGNIKIN
jgi:hypothetical protein